MQDNHEDLSVWDVDPVSSMLQRIHFQYVSKRLRYFSVVSEKRGEGKTTVSILLARGLAEIYGFKVLLVDLNSQGDHLLSKYLRDYQTENGIVLESQFPFSIFRIKDLDVDWTQNVFDGPYLNRLITNFTSTFDIVIVDIANPYNENEAYLKVNTDSNLIVCSQSLGHDKNSKLQNEIELNRKNIIGVVLNK